MNLKRTIFKLLSLLIMAIMTLSSVPCSVIAQNNAAGSTEESFIYVDGEPIPISDARFQNVVTVQSSLLRSRAARSARPNVTQISGLPGTFERQPDVKMDSVSVSAQRYMATVDGVSYEAYCANPTRKGPENPGAVYELTGEASTQIKTVLMNGYPVNTEWSSFEVSQDDRLWWTYITRVAVAMANNPNNNFTGSPLALEQAGNLAGGNVIAPNTPTIMVNGAKNAQDTGRDIQGLTAQSQAFSVSYNRKTNMAFTPFRFEWVQGTPDGAKLIVDGNVVATSPDNSDTVFGEDIKSFQIEMPNDMAHNGKTAAVNLVGIHNQFADKVWLLQNPNNPDDWQNVVFYIPEATASAAFSFNSDEIEPGEVELRIIKQDNSGKGLDGAVFEITGPGGYSKQETSQSDGMIMLTGLQPGEYTVTEKTPPAGHKLAEPASKTVTIAPDDEGVIEEVFVNEPEDKASEPTTTGVKIQKIDALTRKNIPGALVRLQGMTSATATLPDGQLISFNNTGINISQVLSSGAMTTNGTVTDGVWTLGDLPYGFYIVYEERAPENYSLLPQHTAYGFFLAPPDIEVKVDMPELGFNGSASEGSVNIDVTLGDDVSHSGGGGGSPKEGWNWSDSLTVTPPLPDFQIVETPNDNSTLITFENYPFGKIEVTKYDMVTEEPLAGTHFRIQGYFPEGNTNGMPIDRVQVTGSNGKTVFEDLPAGQYTITEIEAPAGYMLDHTEYRSISLTWGQTESTSFYNKPKTFVEVIKIDGEDSGKLLDGAVFRLTDPTTGEIWEGTTEGGKVRLGEGDGSLGNQLTEEKLYILNEIQAPPGYVFDTSPIEVIVAADNQLNIVTVKNFLKPILTIRKYDELTNEPLADASFRLWKTEGETWSETQVTDLNGEITWADLDPGIYSIQEIDEPYGYFQDPARKEILLKGGDHKELEFFNRPRPVLRIFKRDAVTGEPLSNVKFRVQRLEGETIGEFLTDENGMIELSPKTGYLLEEEIYRVTEITPPENYLLDTVNVKDVMLKWQEPTELIFENVLKPTLIFIKRNGLTGRGISDATYKIEYEGANGGVSNLGSTFKTKCGLIVIPYVETGWYVLTETIPAPGYSLPTNPVQRMYIAPGANSYTYGQTQNDLYVDPRTNPNSGERGDCGDWCGYLCSILCAGNCGNPGGGNMSGSTGGKFGDMTITNGKGDSLGNLNDNPGNSSAKPVLTGGTVTRNSNLSATVQFTSSAAGKYYYSAVTSGAAEPALSTAGLGASCSAGVNTVTVYMTSGAKDLYIKVKDASGNVSNAIKIAVPAYSEQTAPTDPPDFDNIIVSGGTVVYLNPDFSEIKITFGF